MVVTDQSNTPSPSNSQPLSGLAVFDHNIVNHRDLETVTTTTLIKLCGDRRLQWLSQFKRANRPAVATGCFIANLVIFPIVIVQRIVEFDTRNLDLTAIVRPEADGPCTRRNNDIGLTSTAKSSWLSSLMPFG